MRAAVVKVFYVPVVEFLLFIKILFLKFPLTNFAPNNRVSSSQPAVRLPVYPYLHGVQRDVHMNVGKPLPGGMLRLGQKWPFFLRPRTAPQCSEHRQPVRARRRASPIYSGQPPGVPSKLLTRDPCSPAQPALVKRITLIIITIFVS